jgi:hypothetical protein
VVRQVFAAAALLIAACGGASWSIDDANNAAANVRAQLLIEQMCEDAGACVPEQVRALERSALCGSESMLYRHKLPVPDGGPACPAR